MSEYITDPEFDGTLEEVREHYERVRTVYEELALLGEEYPTLAFAGNAGWYKTRDETDLDAIEAGWTKRGRCRTLERDLDEILRRQVGADDRDREIFNISSWKAPDAPYTERSYTETDDGKKWADDETPMPDYSEVRGFGFWCDLDLADKAGREELSESELAAVEQAQQTIIEELADLHGVADSAIYALDSGGGAYIYGPPEVALPIAEELEDEAERALFFDDMAERMRGGHLGEQLEEAIADNELATELLDPDWLQNKNRQTKAPGAIHHDHDLVVTPLRSRDPETGAPTSEVSYEPTQVSEFDEDGVAELEAWAAGLTRIEYTEAVATFIPNLYPELAEEAGGWREVVRQRTETLQQEHKRQRRLAEERRETIEQWAEDEGTTDSLDRSDTTDESDGSSSGSSLVTDKGAYEGSGVVTDEGEFRAALDTIDVRKVMRKHACDAWDTSNRSHETTYDPSWRESGSGKSVAIPRGSNSFIDNGCDAGGGPVKAYALGEDYIESATDDLSDVFGDVLAAMRADGYNIPIYVPEPDEEHDKTPRAALHRAAVALDVLEPDEFEQRESDDGQTYTVFPDAETHNAALAALEDEGIEHGRSRREPATATIYETPSEFTSSDDADQPAEDDDLPATSPEEPAGELCEKDGCYGYWKVSRRDGEPVEKWEQVTNFLLETQEFITTDAGEKMRLRVHPAHPREDAYEVTVEPKVFNEYRTFREKVVIGRTTTFNDTYNALNDLRRTVGAQRAPRRTGVAHVGAATEQLDEWVTPDGVLTADGWADSPDHEYYAQASSDSGDESIVGEKWQLSPSDGPEFDTEAARKAVELLPQSRLPGQAIATMGWFYSAPAKPLIHDEENEFNHLHVRGKTESGKTSYLQLLAEAFGMEPSPWGAEATNFSLEQLHVGSRGAPVWIDEYKPSDMKQRTVNQLHRLLRTATREGVQTKGRPDQSFMKFRLQSPVCLSGEQQVSEPAVRRRMLQVNLSERATQRDEHVEAYSRLSGEPYEDSEGQTQTPASVDLSAHAMAYYRFLLSRDTEELRLLWSTSRDEAGQLLDELDLRLQDSEFQAAQTVVFGYRLYRRFANELGVPDDRLPGDDALRKAVDHLSGNVGTNGQRREHGDEFLELLAQAAQAGYVSSPGTQDGDAAGYRVYEPTLVEAGKEALAVHLPTAYPAVKRYARDYNIEDEYNLLGKSDYTDEFGDLARAEGSHVLEMSHPARLDGSLKRCLMLDPHATRAKLGENFDVSAFGIVSEEDAAAEDEEEEPAKTTTEQAEPIGGLDCQRSASFTARVVSVDDGEYNREAQGLLEDAEPVDGDQTTVLGFVVPGGNENPLHGRQGKVCEFDRVTIRTDDDGLLEAVLNDASTVSIVDDAAEADDDGGDDDGDAAAAEASEPDPSPSAPASDDVSGAAEPATDGGPPADAEGPQANAQRLRKALHRERATTEDDAVPKGALPELADVAPDDLDAAIEHGASKMVPAPLRCTEKEGKEVVWAPD